MYSASAFFQPLRRLGAVLAFSLLSAATASAQTSILNVSYDVARELYKDINAVFIAQQKAAGANNITVKQSHGSSSKQVLAVAAGLEADVITMNQASDIDVLAEKGNVATDWRNQFPHEAAPYASTIVFLVRKGNPKGIKDWGDLVREDVSVLIPNPKTSGNGRYTYLAAWVYGLEKTGSETGAKEFVRQLFSRVPVFDGGGRGATTSFTQRGLGDALITFENEAILIERELGKGAFQVVYPSISVDASAPVAIVQTVVNKRGTKTLAETYLNFLFSPEGQEIIAQHNFRPRDINVQKKYADRFPMIRFFSVEERLGGWDKVKKTHFEDGAVFDQIVVKR